MNYSRHDSCMSQQPSPSMFAVAFAVIMAAVMVLSGGARAIAREAVGVSMLPTPQHRKYVESNGDGTYDVTLTVRGEAAESVAKNTHPADIVLVLDKSGSMSEKVQGNRSRWDVVKEAADRLTKRLLTGENAGLPESLRTRMSVVLFDNTASYGTLSGNGWSTSAHDVISTFGTIDGNKSTNWEDGLKLANERARTGRAGVGKYIVFLTDGMPTFRNTAMGHPGPVPPVQEKGVGKVTSVPKPANNVKYRYEDGVKRLLENGKVVYGNGALDYQNRCYDAAVKEANRRPAGTSFFAVSTGGDASNDQMQRFAGLVGGQFFDGSDPDKLGKAFDDIIRQIIITAWRYRDVTIMDELSEYVTPVLDENGRPRYASGAVDATGKSVSDDAALTTLRVSYDTQSKKLTAKFQDGVMLSAGVTYWVKITVKPTDKAYGHYVKQDGQYPHVGDDDTDAPGKHTSSKQPGFHSNKSNATLTYVVSSGGNERAGERQSARYPHPVVQITPSTLTLVAKVNNTYAGRHGAKPSHWKLSALNANGDGLTGAESGSKRMVAPGTYTLQQQSDTASGYQHFLGYAMDGWSCTDGNGQMANAPQGGKVTVAEGQNVICTVTYTALPGKVVWSKVDAHSTATLLPGSHWSLSSSDVPGFEARNIRDNGEHDADQTIGGLAVTGLAWGEYTLTETKAPDGYQKPGKPLNVKVFPGLGEMAQGSFTVKAGEGGKVTNRKVDAMKPAGLAATGACATGGVMVMMLALAAGGLAAYARRRSARR